jgi:hypothetical protein
LREEVPEHLSPRGRPHGRSLLLYPDHTNQDRKGERTVSGEIAKWKGGEAARQHARDIDAVVWRADVHHAQVAAIGQVTRRAQMEALYINLERKQAEHLAPDGAEQYALIAWRGAMALARRIDALESGW